MPASLAERVRERRNQRLAAHAQRRAQNERNNSSGTLMTATSNSHQRGVVSPPSAKSLNRRSTGSPLVSLLDTAADAALPHSSSGYNENFGSSSNYDDWASTPQRGTSSRPLVSPLYRPPASPTQRGTYVSASAPSSPRTLAPSPRDLRLSGSSSSRARNLYNTISQPSSSSSSHRRSHSSSNAVVHSFPHLSGPSQSWDEGHQNDSASAVMVPTLNLSLRTSSDRSVASEISPRWSSSQQHAQQHIHHQPWGRSSDSHSVYSDSHAMDDAEYKHPRSSRRNNSSRHRRTSSVDQQQQSDNRSYSSRRSVDEDDSLLLPPRRSSKPPSSVRVEASSSAPHPSYRPQSSSNRHSTEDDVSSLGGVEDQMSNVSRTSLLRLTAAVRLGTPKGLLAEERALWETFQSSLAASRQAALQEADPALREKLTKQQEEQDKSLRAIQRVLADVSDERDKITAQWKESKQEQRKLLKLVEKLEEQVDDLRDKQRSSPPQAVRETESLAQKARLEELERKIQNLQADKEKMAIELESRNTQITKLRQLQHGKGEFALEDPEGRKELNKLTADLESAKMIITSLENARNTLSADTRSRVKAKDTEILSMKTNARHQQKKLDNLATQLKEVQAEKAQLVEERSHEIGRLAVWKLTLHDRLEEMQSAAVILEATRDDPTAAERFSHIVGEALEAMQKTVDSVEQITSIAEEDEDGGHPPSPVGRYDGSNYSGTDVDSIASSRSVGSRLSRDTTREVRQELEEKAFALKRLEEELRKAKEEAHNSRLEAGRVEQQLESDKKTLQGEIDMLRIHCNTNMELLTKKERELTVLRDSLKVEDDSVGYISDDATDIEDEDEGGTASNANPSMTQYGASHNEALASLLAHGGRGSVESIVQAGDADKLKYELNQARLEAEKSQKELKMEKESLANAKMIISSLEKANKSMMEDLRSRLQESNTAIHSLLEKSMESEKTTKKLEVELETLRHEKEELLSKKGLMVCEEKKDEILD